MNHLIQLFSRFLSFFTNRYYREFIILFLRYGNLPRKNRGTIHFLSFTLDTSDIVSTLFQYKDIFVNENYRFSSNNQSPVILDCGANVGVSCLYFKHIFPQSKITAYEADPSVSKLLVNNLLRNDISDITVVPKAIWIHDQGISFGSDESDGGSIYNPINPISIPTVRLRDELLRHDHIDMLKIDIEGAETDVIVDCDDMLQKTKCLFIEYHSLFEKDQRLDEILSVLRKNNFKYILKEVGTIASPFVALAKNSITFQINIYAVRS